MDNSYRVMCRVTEEFDNHQVGDIIGIEAGYVDLYVKDGYVQRVSTTGREFSGITPDEIVIDTEAGTWDIVEGQDSREESSADVVDIDTSEAIYRMVSTDDETKDDVLSRLDGQQIILVEEEVYRLYEYLVQRHQ